MRKGLLGLFLALGFASFTLTGCLGNNFPSQRPTDVETVPTDIPDTKPSENNDGSSTIDTTPGGNAGGDASDSSTNPIKEYTISFIVDDVIYKSIKTTGDEAISLPSAPNKPGYEFVGWYLDKDIWQVKFSATTLLDNPINKSIAAYAYFIESDSTDATIEVLNATLKDIEGIGSAYFVEVAEEQIIYNFSSNVIVKGNGTYIVTRDLDGKDDIPSKNVSLAKGENNIFFIHLSTNDKIFVYPIVLYREASLVVEFDTLGGNIIEPIEISKGEILNDIPVAFKKGYTFKGWDYDFKKPITGNIKAKAIYEANKYKITYNYGYGDKVIIKNVLYDEDIKLELPLREGYTFKGWSYNNEMITDFKYNYTENITLTAVWEEAIYNISYNLNGGVYDATLNSEYSISNPITLPKPTKEGYIFKGWSTSMSIANIITGTPGVDIFKDLELNAIFIPSTYKINLDTNGGNEGYFNIDAKYNTYIKLPTPTKDNAEFVGWYYNDRLVDQNLYFNYLTDINLVAHWIEYRDYKVSIKAISGKPIENALVSFTDGEILKELYTDSEGNVLFNAVANQYTVEVTLPDGYIVSDNIQITDTLGTPLEFICNTTLINSTAPSNNKYKLYDVMYDFTLTDSNGNQHTLSDYLKNHDVVFLNFWYSGCSNCMMEFSHINDAYNSISSQGVPYSDKVAFIAVNPVIASEYPEDMNFVDEFKKEYGFSFDMLTDYNLNNGKPFDSNEKYTPALNSMFGVYGYPTTVIIDRNGYINEIIVGGMPDVNKWTGLFEKYIGWNYRPDFNLNIEDNTGFIKNQVEHPDYTKINDAVRGINHDGSKFMATYERETNINDEPYAWPWLIGQDGVSIVPSNLGVDRSFSTIYLNVALKKNEVFTFDININVENEHDMLYVIVDDMLVQKITGVKEGTIFSYPAPYEDEFKFAFLYLKDVTASAIDERVSLSNFRIERSIVFDNDEADTYIYRLAASGEYSDYLGRYEHYSNVVFNENDGYYHVDSKNGPLLQANLIDVSNFNPNFSLYSMVVAGKPSDWVINGIDCGAIIVEYAGVEVDSISGYVPVDKRLKEALELSVKKFGKDSSYDNPYQWLELCVYFDVYGPTKLQMPSPVKGLVPWESYKLDYNSNSGSLYYEKPLINRGYLVEFKPQIGGVYKFTSKTDVKLGGTDLLIYDDKLNVIGMNDRFTREQAIRYDNYEETMNFISYFYYEAGKTYYLRPYFIEQVNGVTLDFNFEYLGPTYELYTAAAEETFTTDVDPDNDPDGEILEENIISRSYVTPILGPDGYYIAKNSNSTDKYIYFDAKQTLSVLGGLAFEQLFDIYDIDGNKLLTSAFDFTVDEMGTRRVNEENQLLKIKKDEDGLDMIDKNGHYIYTAEVRYDKYGRPYTLYDATERVKTLVAKNIISSSDPNIDGLVKVDQELAEILQMLMDKYTFIGVENSWLKLCYYQKNLISN